MPFYVLVQERAGHCQCSWTNCGGKQMGRGQVQSLVSKGKEGEALKLQSSGQDPQIIKGRVLRRPE